MRLLALPLCNRIKRGPGNTTSSMFWIIAGADLEYNSLLSHKMHFYGDVFIVFGICYHKNLTAVGRK